MLNEESYSNISSEVENIKKLIKKMNDTYVDLFETGDNEKSDFELTVKYTQKRIHENINKFLGIDKIYTYNGLHKYEHNVFDYYPQEYISNKMNKFNVWVCFPNQGIRIDIKLDDIKNMSCIEPILNGSFQEQYIQLQYYNDILNEIVDGPKLIILTLPIESVLLTVKNIKYNKNYYSSPNNENIDNDTNNDTNNDEEIIITTKSIPLDRVLYLQDSDKFIR